MPGSEEEHLDLIEENARLRKVLAEQETRITDQAAKITELAQALKLQQDINAELLRRIYGRSSEKIDPNQLLLALQGEEEGVKKPDTALEPATETVPRKPRKPPVQRLKESMKSLPTTTRTLVPKEVEENPDAYTSIGEEVSERLIVTPAKFAREVTVRPIYVPKASGENKKDALPAKPIIADLPTPFFEGSVLTPSLAAYLLTEKFVYHQPFYRLQWRLRHSYGLEMNRNTMCNWHDYCADLLQPLYNLLIEHLCRCGYIRVDETPIKFLDPGKGLTSTGQLWVYYHAKYGVVYDWHTSRAHTCLYNVLGGDPKRGRAPFQGYLQSDGFAAYQTYIQARKEVEITPVSCLAHIRRKFVAAKEDHPRTTAWILNCIGKIYQIERDLREQGSDANLRKEVRSGETRRRYDHLVRLVKYLLRNRRITPASNLGKALAYANGQLPNLEACFIDGQIEFDNNRTENAVRPTKLGAKNWMFIGREDTGQRSAIIYTFVEQVRELGLDPFAYLEWVFERLPTMTNQDDLNVLLPKAWAATLKSSTERGVSSCAATKAAA